MSGLDEASLNAVESIPVVLSNPISTAKSFYFNDSALSVMEKSFATRSTEVWYIAVPTNQEFTAPQFHFGERVSWWVTEPGSTQRFTGRITGIWFYQARWNYDICLDTEDAEELEERVTLLGEDLTLVFDECTARGQIDPLCEWLPTRRAAQRLGLAPEQLRHLRQQGRFVIGYHCRDASIPGSRKPLWQWHIGRCNEALTAQTCQTESLEKAVQG